MTNIDLTETVAPARSALEAYAEQRAVAKGLPPLMAYLYCVINGREAAWVGGVPHVTQLYPLLSEYETVKRVAYVLDVCAELYEKGQLGRWLVRRFNEFEPTILGSLAEGETGETCRLETMMPVMWSIFSGPVGVDRF